MLCWFVERLVGSFFYGISSFLGYIHPHPFNPYTEYMISKQNFILLSSLPCGAISTDISDPFSPPFSIVHCFQYNALLRNRIEPKIEAGVLVV